MLRRLVRHIRRLVSTPPLRAVLGFFCVGAAIGIGSACTALLPGGIEMLAPLLLAAGALVGYYSFVRVVERRAVVELLSKGSLAEALAGAAIGSALFGLVIGILFLLDVYSVSGVNAPSAAVPALMLALMAGITEELLLRAVAFRILEEWLGSWLALGLSAALFGLMHLPNPEATLMSSTAIALEAGVMLAAAYMVTRRVWLAIGIHASWNFAQSGIFGVATSGVESAGYLNGQLSGHPVLSGGSFGPEASIVAVAVCLAAGLLLLRMAHDRGHVRKPSWRAVTGSREPVPDG
ncbi:MAG TPA: CPBP family intramembrane glutamic endopeptidase [Caldimonas sp.]|nr:CPBP family intramembrane glutamic endopeptidase [Caldimonas sp.]